MMLQDLLSTLSAGGFSVVTRDPDGIAIRGPVDQLTPDLQDAIRFHKRALLALAVCQARVADERSGPPPAPLVDQIRQALGAPGWHAVEPCRRCGSHLVRDVLLTHSPHGGRSTRRDCGECGGFIGFTRWHGRDTQ